MKIAVTSTGSTLDDQVEARFGRCAYFLIVDPDIMAFEALENPNIALGGGAGIQSAQLLAQREVQTVLTGNCGPNAFQTFGAAGIQVITGVDGPVRQAVEQFKAGAFSAASGPSVDSKFGVTGGAAGEQAAQGSPQPIMPGIGMGRGMGGGMGVGRGMGRGRGRGIGRGLGGGMGAGMAGFPMTGPSPQMSKEQELDMLKQQARAMAEQLEEIQKRIAELEKKK
jgi:predicted Fe-Mo cluster-binding NifX family protein